MKFLNIILFLLLSNIVLGQNFTYSGYIYNAGGLGAPNVPVKLYKRTTPNLVGFTSQTNYNGHSYYRSTGSMTWTSARQACIDMGGHLVTITSAAENNFVFNTWPSGWIGFNDEAIEGQWRWVTGESVVYTNWNGGEPNNSGNEDYAQFVSGGRWNDLPNTSLPYVLEFDYIVGFTPWVLHQTVFTNSNGYFSFSQPTNPATEWYIQIDVPNGPVTSLSNNDLYNANFKVLNRNFTSIDYFRYDVNNDGKITISDVYYIHMKKAGLFLTWTSPLPKTRLFTQAEYNSIINSTTDLRPTYVGSSNIILNSPTNGGSSSYYIINTGYSNSTILTY